MIKKSCKIWWLFSVISLVFAYANPFLGIFGLLNLINCFFDFGLYVILNGHYVALEKKMRSDGNFDKLKKAFNIELIGFIGMKVFTLVCIVFGTTVVIVTNIEVKKIAAPFYFNFIADSFILQMICTILSLFSAVYSCVLFIFYAISYKQK